MGKKTRFCANCGKETDKLINNVCSECYPVLEKITIPKRIIQKICSRCGAIFSDGIWVKSNKSIQANISEKLKKSLTLPEAEKLKDVEVDLKNSTARIKAGIFDEEFNLDKQVKIELIKLLCNDCRELASTKHTDVIQIRFKNFSSKHSDAAFSMLREYGRQIQKVDEQRDGIDIFLKNHHLANSLARRLSKEFNCRTSRTVELYSWEKQQSRPKTRHTILLRQI